KAQLAPALLWVSPDSRYYLSEFIVEEPLLTSAQCERLAKIPWSALACQVGGAQLLAGPRQWGASAYPNAAHTLLLRLLLQLRDLPTGDNSIAMCEQWQQYQLQLQRLLPRGLSCDWQLRARQLLSRQSQITDDLATLKACLIRPQFCHRDLNPHNLLLKQQRLYCIDFEYAAASHPLFDIATVLATHRLTPAQQRCLLQQYLDKHPHLTKDAEAAVPAAMAMYWIFACAWALLMAAAEPNEARLGEYLGWFDGFWAALASAP
ncbi:MAG: phosphotransferase family protein, partial [Shewanella sp.]